MAKPWALGQSLPATSEPQLHRETCRLLVYIKPLHWKQKQHFALRAGPPAQMAQTAAETLKTPTCQPAVNTKLSNALAAQQVWGTESFFPRVSVLGTPMRYLLEPGTKRQTVHINQNAEV